MESKNAVLYARSATIKKPGDNNSVDVQLEKLREYARKNDYQVLAEFVDEGEGGHTDNRPALKNMLGMITARPDVVDAILVCDRARLSRSLLLGINLKEKF